MTTSRETPDAPVPAPRRRRPIGALAKLLLALLLAAGSTVLLPQAAQAASPSLGWFGAGGASGIGRWTVGSTIVYCVDPLYGSPSGSNGSPQSVGVGDSLNHLGPRHRLTAKEIAKINWAITTYGMMPGSDTGARRWAAAVQLYIWSIAAPEVYADPGAYAGTGSGHGDSWFSARIQLHGGTAADRAAVLDRLARLREEDDGVNANVPAVGGSITVEDAGDDDATSFRIRTTGIPSGVEYRVVLTNARFPDGSSSRSLSSNTSQAVVARPPSGGEANGYTITARISYSRGYWPDDLRLWTPSGGQRVATGRQLLRSHSASGGFAVGGAAPELFAPVVTTSAPRLLLAGEGFDDTLVFDVAAHGGATNPWGHDPGSGYTPITATGRLYGPFAGQPVRAAGAPAGAPVAAVATITTSPDAGPGAYSVGEHGRLVEGGLTAGAAGFYSWVWEIDAADQSPAARERLPEGYSFRDAFGLAAETSVVAMAVEAVTAVTAPEVALGAPVQDVLAVRNEGLWLEDGGSPIPVTFRGTAFYLPGATPPAESGEIPLAAEAIGSTSLTVTAPGSYASAADGLLAPDDVQDGGGHVVWRWEILPEDQPEQYRGWVADWADLFGVAAETQRLLVPEVVTRAQQTAAVGAGFTDTAIVTGTLPEGGALLGFELYDAAVGPEAEPLWISEPQLVTAPGEYVSPPAPGQLPGRYHWVEVLGSVEDLDGDGRREILRGEWGLAEETTTVAGPGVVTRARPGAPSGGGIAGAADPSAAEPQDAIYDTATVSGPIPAGGAELVFEAYLVPVAEAPEAPGGPLRIAYPDGVAPGDLSWACTEENRVFTSAAVPVAAAGEYRSEAFAGAGHGLYLWTEALSVDLGAGRVEIHRGACGLAEETSAVVDVATRAQSSDPSGQDPAPLLWDTAELVGWVPEDGSLVFEAYRAAADAAPLCTADTLVHRTGPVGLAGGLYLPGSPLRVDGGRYEAEARYGSGTRVYWVQRLYDGLGRLVGEGECGDPLETTGVPAPPLTTTGIEAPVLLIGGSAAALLPIGLAALLLAGRRRRRRGA